MDHIEQIVPGVLGEETKEASGESPGDLMSNSQE